jgi:3-hydroxyisobutyrate dehydrogenase-like beta-hydroxyacid dehydrogenase
MRVARQLRGELHAATTQTLIGLMAVTAIRVGEAIGLDREKLLSALEQMAAVAPAHKGKIDNVRKDTYEVAFALRLMDKDFGLVLDEAARAGLSLPATQASAGAAAAALETAEEDVDFSFVARQYDTARDRS